MTGHGAAFAIAVAVIIAWAIAGPALGYSDTWQLTISTVTGIVTFLMVFVIQHSQTRDTEAMQIKLDELLRVTGNADRGVMDLENQSESELARRQKAYTALARESRGPRAPKKGR